MGRASRLDPPLKEGPSVIVPLLIALGLLDVLAGELPGFLEVSD